MVTWKANKNATLRNLRPRLSSCFRRKPTADFLDRVEADIWNEIPVAFVTDYGLKISIDVYLEMSYTVRIELRHKKFDESVRLVYRVQGRNYRRL